MKILVEFNDEQLDKVIAKELSSNLGYLKSALKNAKKGHLTGVYSWSREKEIKGLKKAIKAYKFILDEYTLG